MSAYMEVAMPILDEECLIQALEEMGFTKEMIEIHKEAVKLEGYEGSLRNNTANIVIRRKFVGSASNDLGFKKTASGYKFVVSDYDSRGYNKTWQNKLMEHYSSLYSEKLRKIKEEEERKRIEEENRLAREERRNQIIESAKKRGYTVSEKRVGKTIQLVLQKREY